MGWEMVPSNLFCCLLLFSGIDPYVKWLCKHRWPPQVTMKLSKTTGLGRGIESYAYLIIVSHRF